MTVALGAMGTFAFEWALLSFIQKKNFPVDVKLLEIFNVGRTSVFSGIALVLLVFAVKENKSFALSLQRLEKISYVYYEIIALTAFVVTAGTLLFQKKNQSDLGSLSFGSIASLVDASIGEFPVLQSSQWRAIEHLVQCFEKVSIYLE